MAVGAIVYNYNDLMAGNMSLLDYAAFFLVIPFILSFGVYLVATPMITKIVTSPEELEYHTLAHVTSVGWQEFRKAPRDEIAHHRAVAAETQAPPPPHIKPRQWTKFTRLGAKKRVMEQGIPLYMFGGYRGRQLMADIRRYAPHLDL